MSEAKKKLAMGGGAAAAGDGADGVRTVGDVKLMARAVDGIELKDLRSLADEGKKQVGSGVVAIVGVTGDGKAGIVVGVTDDLVARFNAVDLVRKGAEALGGKGGGGRPDMAQAGGPDGSKADAALKAIEARSRLSCVVYAPRSGASSIRRLRISPNAGVRSAFADDDIGEASTIMPSSAVSNGSSRAARQHVGAHVGEDQPLRPDLAELAFERRQCHVRLDRFVAHVGLADEQIGLDVQSRSEHRSIRCRRKSR